MKSHLKYFLCLRKTSNTGIRYEGTNEGRKQRRGGGGRLTLILSVGEVRLKLIFAILPISHPLQVIFAQSLNLKTYGSRDFAVSAPDLWNSSPDNFGSCDNLNTFKSKLKTYLSKKAYHS